MSDRKPFDWNLARAVLNAVGAAVMAVIVLLALARYVRGAPAPFARPGKDVVGAWRADGLRATFRPDGTYAERWHGFDFAGRWRVRGGGVVEATYPHCDWPHEPPFRKKFCFHGDRLKMLGVVEFTLERAP